MPAVWRAWQAFAKGKRQSVDIMLFRSHLESNLLNLARDLQQGQYKHGAYNKFVVHDPKRREISVASVRDRVVHRLLYDYLVNIWDKSFCYDVWSCRINKGLHGAINRSQNHVAKYNFGWLWRSDIVKFFDNVDHNTIRYLLRTKVKSPIVLGLLDEVIASYNCSASQPASQPASQSVSQPASQSVSQAKGLPIGNLTSQILANVYLNEFDQFVLHSLKPLGYVRYGDDFVLWFPDEFSAREAQVVGTQFLCDALELSTNPKHDKLQPVKKKLAYLGIDLWPNSIRINKRTQKRISSKLSTTNAASQQSITKHYLPARYNKRFTENLFDVINQL